MGFDENDTKRWHKSNHKSFPTLKHVAANPTKREHANKTPRTFKVTSLESVSDLFMD